MALQPDDSIEFIDELGDIHEPQGKCEWEKVDWAIVIRNKQSCLRPARRKWYNAQGVFYICNRHYKMWEGLRSRNIKFSTIKSSD
jgi:hypothetical protein